MARYHDRQLKLRGFALLELLVIVVILGMVSALVFPSMSRTMTGVRLKTSSRDVLNLFRIARETAIRGQEAHKIRVDFVNRTISLTDYFGEPRSQYQLLEDIALDAIRLEGAEVARQEIVDLVFYPEGYATGAELVLKIRETDNKIVLRIDAVTGTALITKVLNE